MSLKNLTEHSIHKLLKQTLQYMDYEIVDYNLTPLSEKSGFLGEHSILNINIMSRSRIKEVRFFVKSMSTVESQKKIAIETGAFFKEEQMFEKIIPHLLDNGITIINECLPKCYLTSSLEYFIFEDLSASGYKLHDHRESLPLDYVKLAMDAMSKLHASGLILEEKVTLDTGKEYRIGSHYGKEFNEAFYSKSAPCVQFLESAKKGILTHIDLFADTNSKNDQELFKSQAQNAIDRFRDFVMPSKDFRNTICHGDLWASNLMFQIVNDKPVHCSLVDFQSYRYCPAAHDVMSFIYLSTDREFRKKYMEEILTYYFTKLHNNFEQYGLCLEIIMSYNDFLASCKYYELFAVTQAVTHFHNIMMSTNSLKEFFDIPGYSQQILFQDRSDLIIKLCSTDPIYRRRQYESITDLQAICKRM